MFNGAVRRTEELERVLKLPRRSHDPAETQRLVDDMTEVLKTPGGTQRLRDVQAIALYEIGTVGGLFGPIGVGEGKSLITMLAPFVLGAERPLLILPASLIGPTKRKQKELSEHWLIPKNLQLISYEMLGRVQSAAFLDVLQPDLIIADEAHKLKNKKAAVTRRVARFMRDHD